MNSASSMSPTRLLPFVLALALAGCAAGDLPLPTRPELAGSLSDLRHEQVTLGPPLSVSAIAVLAVQNDPDLRATRAQHGVAQAQLLQAGLLPNPQLNAAALPLLLGPGSTMAWNAGLTEDIKALITLSSRRRQDCLPRPCPLSCQWRSTHNH